MIIMKFGGSSVGNAERISNVANIILNAHRKKLRPVVVVSAVQGITDLLLATAHAALSSDEKTVNSNLQEIHRRHQEIIDKNFPAQKTAAEKLFKKYLEELQNLLSGIRHLKELSARTIDLVSSFGERISSHLVAFTLENVLNEEQNHKFPAKNFPVKNAFTGSTKNKAQNFLAVQRFSSAELIRTDESFGNALVDFPTSRKLFQKKIAPFVKKGGIPIITGFFGSSATGEIVTLGRGGSDYSAAIAGISLDTKEIQIWTDVDGIMTTDPRMVPHARIVPQISFQEAAELAYFGAKVLHPKTIQPAIEKNIPVRILNTFNPENKGTLITGKNTEGPKTVKAIAFQKGITLINICSSRMLGQHGFLARTFQLFEKYKVSVDVVATSEVSIGLTILDKDLKKDLLKELSEFSTVRTQSDQALICIVGNKIKYDIAAESRIYQTLARLKIPTELVSKGASLINLTLVIDKKNLETAVKALHKELLE